MEHFAFGNVEGQLPLRSPPFQRVEVSLQELPGLWCICRPIKLRIVSKYLDTGLQCGTTGVWELAHETCRLLLGGEIRLMCA